MPDVDCPDDSPSVAAVTTQPNASVAVPLGAVASTPREWAVTCGVIVAPASSIATTSAGNGPATAIAPTQSANASNNTGSRRCNGRGHGRSEYATPASTDVIDQADSSTPPSAAEPAAAVTAGTPTSTLPMTRPNPSDASTIVRRPGTASAPNRPVGAAGTGRCVRTAWVSANAADPVTIRTSATAVPVPGHGSSTSSAASDGPRMKNTSRLIAS